MQLRDRWKHLVHLVVEGVQNKTLVGINLKIEGKILE
jgi:hypothetical protein